MTKGNCLPQNSGGALVTTAAALAVALAQGRSGEEVELLGLFFTALGDNLSLYAARLPEGGQAIAEPAGTEQRCPGRMDCKS